MAEISIISLLKDKGFLSSPDMKDITLFNIEPFLNYIAQAFPKKPFVITKKMYEDFLSFQREKNKESFAPLVKEQPKQIENEGAATAQMTQTEISEEEDEVKVYTSTHERFHIDTSVKIKRNYDAPAQKVSIQNFVQLYNDRYRKMKEILLNRTELKNAISISRIDKMSNRQKVETIGMIHEMKKTFNGNLIITLEDPTGMIPVCIKNGNLPRIVEQLTNDEIIGVLGNVVNKMVYAENIIFPEIPTTPIKKAGEEVYAAFLSDIHVGSNMFLHKEFSQCIDWLSGRIGSQAQRSIAEKIKYLFIVGDLVDGVGVYPGQDKELKIKDIYEQYNEVASFISRLPTDIHVIAVPGNHDALRLAEPQPPLLKEYAESLYKLPNVTFTSNPSVVTIHEVDKSPGFNVMSYHGQSFDYYVANSPCLRETGYNRADLIHEMLLRKRHLSPTHGATTIHPSQTDALIIDAIPDILATGHIHKTNVGRYKNIITLNCGCFQDKTSFQEKVGHNPEPGRVPIINLQSSEVKIMRFK